MPIVPRRAVLSQPIPIAVPSQPPSIPPMQAEVDHRRDDHPIPKSPAPALIEIPSSSIPPPLQASSSTHGPQHSNVPRPANVPQAINDVAQIDPALLEAVVTALQHVEQTQGSSVPPTHPHEAPAVHGDAEQSSTSPQAQPQSRPQRKRTKKTDTQDATEGNDETEGSSPSTSSKKKRASRKRVRSGTPEASQCEDNVDTPGTPSQRKRKKSGTPRKRKSRPPSPPPFDPNADPGDDIDPTAVTMGALCDDPGRGRVSSKAAQILGNHATWRAANREKRARMRAIMEAKKYGRDLEEEEENATKKVNGSPTTPSTNSDPTTSGGTSERPQDTTEPEVEEPDDANNKVHGFDYSQDIATSRYNVQVRIGPNGETIIDEDSLFVDRNQEEDTAAYTHIEESDTSKFVNSSTYSKKLRGSRWSAEETELFYDVCILSFLISPFISIDPPLLPSGSFAVRRELRAHFLHFTWT